jgi:hypothetical protein
MLPLTVLRRFDCVLAPTKEKVVREHERRKAKYKGEALDRVLNRVAGQRFHNHSPLTFEKLKGDPDNISSHLVSYCQGKPFPVADHVGRSVGMELRSAPFGFAATQLSLVALGLPVIGNQGQIDSDRPTPLADGLGNLRGESFVETQL